MNTILAYWYLKLQALILLVFSKQQAALEKFDQMLVLRPGDRYALASRAHVLAQEGDKHGAIAALRLLTERYPDNAAAWFNLAYMLEDIDGHADAEPAFRRALDIEPKMDRAWYGLALLLIRDRRFDEAVQALKKNTELQPMSPFGWYQLARVHVDRQDPDEAVKVIRHLKRFEPKVAAQLERETGLSVAQSS
jgi:predicted Zn-dependent protease